MFQRTSLLQRRSAQPLFRSTRFFLPIALTGVLLVPGQAFAASKEMIQLQTQVQALQDAVARLQQSNDERMGVMKDLVQQTADSVNKMASTVSTLQRQLATQGEAQTAKSDQVSGQVQSLNDSLDELKARLQRIEKNIGDLQSSQQSINARSESGTAPATNASPLTGTDPGQTSAPANRGAKPTRTPAPPPPGFPSDSGTPSAPASGAGPSAAGTAPPVTDLYQTALGDYNGAKYQLASAEFNDVIRFYPDNNLAGNSYYYLGEMLYKQREYGPATKQYDKVIEQYPGNAKIPAAQLRKGQALLAIKQNDAGIRELKSLVQRFPNSPEATQARARLSDLGVASTRRTER